MFKKQILFMALLMAACLLQAQVRPAIIPLDKGWYFTKDDAKANKSINWQPINIPHTWNAKDVMDDTPSYYRNACWYKKIITLPTAFKNKKLFLYFESANQETTVFINGKKAGEHIGGYTRFCIPASEFLHFDGKKNSNEVLVKVDNKFNENIPPLTADFTFYGGIYRSVYLVATNDVHFNVADNASNGIYISTPQVSAAKASIHIKGSFVNETSSEKKIRITSSIIDNRGKKVASIQTIETVQPNSVKQFVQEGIDKIVQPKLWSPENPYLYTVSTILAEAPT